MNELALFAGIGGGILGGHLLGWTTVCAVELEPYAQDVLRARQDDGCLEPFPIWDDIRTFDGKPWRGVVDIITGGFPCQDISCAGRGAGIGGARSGLWGEMSRVIDEVRPCWVLVENSPMLARRGLDRVLENFADLGYNAKWDCFGAGQYGASHPRKRLWLLASDPNQDGPQGGNARHDRKPGEGQVRLSALLASCPFPRSLDDIPAPYVLRAGHGHAKGLDRIAAIGNAQVPLVAAIAWETLNPSASLFLHRGEHPIEPRKKSSTS